MGQPKIGKVPIPKARENIQAEVVDYAYLRASYALNADSIQDVNTYIDLQYLDIGTRVSKYYSRFLEKADSLRYLWLKNHPNAQSIPIWLGEGGKNKYNWSEYQYSEFFKTEKDLTEYARMPRRLHSYDSWYTEAYPLQQWEIGTDTLRVCGYSCQKATCSFRGRNFIAWFAPDIPVNNGPWKFGGLPGLILKVYDTGRLYTFECVGIEQGKFPIKKLEDYHRYKRINRKKLLKFQRQLNENYYKTTGIKFIDMKTGQSLARYTPYEPLELE